MLTGSEAPRSSDGESNAHGIARKGFDDGLCSTRPNVTIEKKGSAEESFGRPGGNDNFEPFLSGHAVQVQVGGHDEEDYEDDVQVQEGFVEGAAESGLGLDDDDEGGDDSLGGKAISLGGRLQKVMEKRILTTNPVMMR